MTPRSLVIFFIALGTAQIIFAITTDSSTNLEVTDLNNNPGIFAIKLGKSNIRQGYHKLIHEIQLHPFQVVIKQYEQIIADLAEQEQLEDVTKILKEKHRQASMSLGNLLPKRIQKRAINVLGSVIKSITGNLDNEDLQNLNNQISTLKQTNQILITENNEQVRINDIFGKRMNNLTKEAYRQAIEINRLMKQARLSLDRSVDWNHILHLHNIIFNLDTIRYHLDAVFEAIQLSKLKIIPTALLYPTELELASQILRSQGVEVNSYDQTYEYLESAVFHRESTITIIIKIPKLANGNFQLIRIEPIPIDHRIININSKYAITSENQSFLAKEKCIKIEDTFSCNIEDLVNVTNNQCHHQILHGNPGSCPFTGHSMSPEVKIIENNGILIKNAVNSTHLHNTCGFGPRNLTGTFFVTFNNCSVTIGNTVYDSKTFRFDNQMNLLPLHFVVINKTVDKNESINGLQDLQINTRHQIHHLEITSRKHNKINSGGIIILAIVTMTILIYLIIKVQILREFTTIRIKDINSSQQLNRDGSI